MEDAVTPEAEKQEVEKQEAEKQEAEKQEAKKQEAGKQEAEKQGAEKQGAEKQEAEKQEVETSEKDLLLKFNCPGCSDFIFPPICTCRSGHCFCVTCYRKMPRCSICKARKMTAKSFALRKLQEMLSFPCKYEDKGCDFTALGNSPILSHQRNCEYAHTLCPLGLDTCQWSGARKDLKAHCDELHSVYLDHAQKLKIARFTELTTQSTSNSIFYVYDTLFRFTWQANAKIGFVRYAVYCLDKSIIPGRFSFEVAIFFEDTDFVVLRMKAPCFREDEDGALFANGMYVFAIYNMIAEYCDESKNLNFGIRIFEN